MLVAKGKIIDNPTGWVVYSRKVVELLGRPWVHKEEIAEALQCYIKPISAEKCAEQLSAPK